jgi:hypothetical protein
MKGDFMATIVTTGRTDIEDFVNKSSDNFTGFNTNHHPFIVFEELDVVRVKLVEAIGDLLSYPDQTKVMAQWPGNFRSDFFQFTVGEVRPLVEARYPAVLESERQRYKKRGMVPNF